MLRSTSGFTTTGLSTITHPENLPDSFAFYRSYTEWVGGLSFIYLVMALYYPETKLAGMKQFLGSGILRFKQLLSTISIILVIYALIMFLLLYIFSQIDILDSISLSFATLTTGGFVPTSTILNSENAITLILIMGGMVIAALPFAFHFGIFSKYVYATKEIKEIFVFIILLTIGIILFLLIEPSFSEKNIGFHLYFMYLVLQQLQVSDAKRFDKRINKPIKSLVPLDKYKFYILSDKAFKEAIFVVFFISYLQS